MKRISIPLFLGLLLIAAGAAAKEIAVPGGAATLEEAVLSLADGDRIVIAPGEYRAALEIPEGIGFSLVGTGGSEKTVIRPASESTHPLVALAGGSARIEGITFDMTETQGAFAVLLFGREIELRDCRFLGGAGVKIDSCEGIVAGNFFEGCFDGMHISSSPLRIEKNLFANSSQYDITCRGSEAKIVRNTFLNTGNACIVIVGKRYHPVVGGAPGQGNVFKGSKFLVIANQSRNEVNARYNYWGPVLTSTMNRLGYPAELDEIQDSWDSDDRAAGMVDYRDWLQSENESGGVPVLQTILLAAALAVLVLILLFLARRKRRIVGA